MSTRDKEWEHYYNVDIGNNCGNFWNNEVDTTIVRAVGGLLYVSRAYVSTDTSPSISTVFVPFPPGLKERLEKL
jgi:hypothetical protein